MVEKPTCEELEKKVKDLEEEIAELKGMKELLQDSEAGFRRMVNQVPELLYQFVMHHDGSFSVPFINDRAYEFFGYHPEEIMKEPTLIANNMHPEDKGLMRDNLTRSAKCMSEFSVEHRLIDPVKGVKWIQARAIPHLIRDGSVHWDGISIDITERREMEDILKRSHDDLEKRVKERTDELEKTNKVLQEKTVALQDVNTALKVLLERREKDKDDIGQKVLLNVKELLVPYIIKLKKGILSESQRSYLDLLESGLQDIMSPFARKLTSRYMRITPGEMQVANLVKEGKTSKEIAEILNSTERAVVAHRSNLRKKLGLKKKSNLRTNLLSIE